MLKTTNNWKVIDVNKRKDKIYVDYNFARL